MRNSLLGLRHDVVVGCDDDDCNIGHLCTAGTHGSKCLVARSVEEGHMTAVLQGHVIGSDVLRNATCLTGDDVGLTNIVEQRGLTMIDMSHHRHDGSTGHQVFLVVLNLCHGLAHLGAHILGGESELLGNQVDGLGIHALIDADHDSDAHASGDDLSHGHIHHGGEFVCGHKLSQLEHLALCCLCLHLVLHALTYSVALLTAILGTLAHLIVLVGQASQCLAYLLCHFLVAHFGLHGQWLALILLLVVAVVVAALALFVLVLCLAGNGIHIHTLLANTQTLLAIAASCSVLCVPTCVVALVAFAAFLLAAFLARAGT